MNMKDYLGFENARNKEHAALYERLLRLALKDEKNVSVLIGHHVCFEINGDLQTENEIPSADCLMFDHDLMTRVFGPYAIPIMRDLASVPCEKRDELLASHLDIFNFK
jgi:hypothetical protein